MGATSVASSKVALSNVRMEEEEARREEKDSVLDSAPSHVDDAQRAEHAHQRQCPGRLLGRTRAHVRLEPSPSGLPPCGPQAQRGLDASAAPSLVGGLARRAELRAARGVLRCWHRPRRAGRITLLLSTPASPERPLRCSSLSGHDPA